MSIAENVTDIGDRCESCREGLHKHCRSDACTCRNVGRRTHPRRLGNPLDRSTPTAAKPKAKAAKKATRSTPPPSPKVEPVPAETVADPPVLTNHWQTPSPPPHYHDEGKDRAPEVATIEVVRVTWLRGQGCCGESLVRNVTAYYMSDGTLLAEVDPDLVTRTTA